MSGPMSRPTRVLVVDDHPMWREAVARDLAAAGYDVVAAPDAPRLSDRETEVLRL